MVGRLLAKLNAPLEQSHTQRLFAQYLLFQMLFSDFWQLEQMHPTNKSEIVIGPRLQRQIYVLSLKIS